MTSKVKTFYVSNPGGKKSKALRVTSSIASGTGKILAMDVTDTSPFMEYLGLTCGGTTCVKTVNPGCKAWGTVTVGVEYTGSVAPKLQYWFTDC